MGKRLLFILSAMLLGTATFAQGHGPFCGAVGTPGCNAIPADSPAIIAWATGCTVQRGPVDIAQPDGPLAHFGNESFGVGPAKTATTSAVSLGDGGSATLTFASPIRNVEGPDLAVFENSFNDSFLELAFVEVSTDGVRFVRFPATSLTPTDVQTGPIGTTDPTMLNNLAGKFRLGYGTPFDLEELRDSTGIDIDSIVYVRVVDVVGSIDPQYATRDAAGRIVNDPYPTSDVTYGSGGFDLTGVAVLGGTAGIATATAAALHVGPNPTTGLVRIGGIPAGTPAVLFSTDGRRIAECRAADGCATFSLTGMPSGVYTVRAGEHTAKVVKRGR